MENPDKRFYVYELRVEGTDHPFYIGKGTGQRITNHLTKRSLAPNSHKNQTIKKALREGHQILATILKQDLSESRAFSTEKKLIAKWGRRDLNTGCLTNQTDGGEGVSGCTKPRSQAHKDAIRRALLGKKKSAEHCANLSKAVTGFKHSVETRLRMSSSHTGVARDGEIFIKAVSTRKQKGPWHSEETKQKISEVKNFRSQLLI
jgi:hypothetical protein